jgi:hypothetical protein
MLHRYSPEFGAVRCVCWIRPRRPQKFRSSRRLSQWPANSEPPKSLCERRKAKLIRARRGVILACGGFERNKQMRIKYQRAPITADWTVGGQPRREGGCRNGSDEDAPWDRRFRCPTVSGSRCRSDNAPDSIIVNAGGGAVHERSTALRGSHPPHVRRQMGSGPWTR